MLSTKAHARILSVDASEALAVSGVQCYVDHNDIPEGGTNVGAVITAVDEQVFAQDKVTVCGAMPFRSEHQAMPQGS